MKKLQNFIMDIRVHTSTALGLKGNIEKFCICLIQNIVRITLLEFKFPEIYDQTLISSIIYKYRAENFQLHLKSKL